MKIIFLIAGVLILAALWRWTPAGEWVDMESARAAGYWIRRQPFTPLLVLSAYILGGMVAFPVTLMVMATVIVFGPWWGLAYALTGSELSALVVFGAGRLLGSDAVRRFSGSLLNRLSRKISNSGLTAIITFRHRSRGPLFGTQPDRRCVRNTVEGFCYRHSRGHAAWGHGHRFGWRTAFQDSLRRPDLGRFTALVVAVMLVGGALVGTSPVGQAQTRRSIFQETGFK